MMTDQSIVKTVTMDEAVLQSGYESDEQDQIDVEADEVVVNESLISLLNQKTITLSSKVDTVELEKAKQSQYEYTGVEGDNFVMRFIGRIVRSLVSVSPENQKDVDELIDYSRGRFKDRNLEQIYSSANRSGNLLQDIATSCVALIAGFVNARFHSIYTIGIPITLTVQILILASAVLGLIMRSYGGHKYVVAFCLGVYLSVVLMGLSWIPFVQSGQMSLISCLYYLQPFLQIELFIAIVCTSLDIGFIWHVAFVSIVSQIAYILAQLISVLEWYNFLAMLSDVMTVNFFFLCAVFKLKKQIMERLRFKNIYCNGVGRAVKEYISLYVVFSIVIGGLVLCSAQVFRNVGSVLKLFLLQICLLIIVQSQKIKAPVSVAMICISLTLIVLLSLAESLYMIHALKLTKNDVRMVVGLCYSSFGQSLLAVAVVIRKVRWILLHSVFLILCTVTLFQQVSQAGYGDFTRSLQYVSYLALFGIYACYFSIRSATDFSRLSQLMGGYLGVPIIPEDEARRFDMQHKQSNKSVGDNNQEISTLSLVNSNSSAQIYTGSNQINE